MELGLCIVWTEGGLHLEELTRKYDNSNFNDRLKCLTESVTRLLPIDSEPYDAYMAWAEQANATRKLRNDLVHGRWGIDIQNQRVVNVTGLPTSQDQRSESYSLKQLRTVNESLISLRTGLITLRKKWPLEGIRSFNTSAST